MQYPKINSLWKRVEGRGQIIEGDYACEEFASVNRWRVHEKVDGTNVRIHLRTHYDEPYGAEAVEFYGRESGSKIQPHLLEYLEQTFTVELMERVFPDGHAIWLFGEGYGPKIQSAGPKYRSDVGFILFDVWANGWWLKSEDVKLISEQLGVPMVPDLGVMSESEAVEFVESRPLSRCSAIEQPMEGIVCRSEPMMLFRNGKPLMWKLKARDFE